MEEKQRGKNKILYWTILLNPIIIALFYKCIKVSSDLCMYGGIRRRVPTILGCGGLILTWLIVWTVFYRKRIKYSEKSFHRGICLMILCIEIVFVLVTTGYYGASIIESGTKYNGKLSWKIDEWTRSKKIKLEHNNIYEDGLEGIFEDLETKIDLPKELYLANQFSVKFNYEGTITSIYSFFYGKDASGRTRTYLLDYDNRKSDKMTVWLDGNAVTEYKESEKVTPLFDMMEHVDLKQEICSYNQEYGTYIYELKYFGYREITSSLDMIVLNQNGEKISSNDVQNENGMFEGYEVSIYTPDKDGVLVTRYMDGSRKIIIEEVEPEFEYEIGKSTTVREDGSVYYFLNESKGWRLVVVDVAAGSRWYVLETTTDGGENWNRAESDPFNGELYGVADSIQFLDEQDGFVLMSGASESYSRLYRTTDGAISFSMIELPTEQIEVEIPDLAEYDYMTMPYKEGNVLKVSLSLEKYDCGKLYFESSNNGESWYYTGFSED